MNNSTTLTAKNDVSRAALILTSSIFGGQVTEIPPQAPQEVSGDDYFLSIAPNIGVQRGVSTLTMGT